MAISYIATVLCILMQGDGKAAAPPEHPHGSAQSTPLAAGSVERALVQRALVAEASGAPLGRLALLAAATLVNPDYKPARWQLGQVKWQGRWLWPEQVTEQLGHEPDYARYRRQHGRCPPTMEGHLKMARWCQAQGMHAQRRAHLQVACRLAPQDPRPHRALGQSLYRGRWLTDGQRAALQDQARRAARAWARWRTELLAIRQQLSSGQPDRRRRAEERLRSVSDPLAIAALEELFSLHSESLARRAVEVIGRMPQHDATRSLVDHAVWSRWQSVRNQAVRELKKRNPEHYVPLLIEYLRPGSFRQSWIVLRDGSPVRLQRVDTHDATNLVAVRYNMQASDLGRALATMNAQRLTNSLVTSNSVRIKNAAAALKSATGADIGTDQSAWRKWWAEVGYGSYEPYSGTKAKRAVRTFNFVACSCFAAGTPVWTQTGLVPIDRLQLGDLVLSMNTETGELAYRPVVFRTIRPRTKMVELRIGDEIIAATLGHPFWVSARGWVKAVELKAGNLLRSWAGIMPLASVGETEPQIAYNLEVAEFRTYFVGAHRILVHDNTPITDGPAPVPGWAGLWQEQAEATGRSSGHR